MEDLYLPVWLPFIPTIISALVQLAKLLLDLAREKDSDSIKRCSLEIEKARISGDTKRLEDLLKQMREGGKCE